MAKPSHALPETLRRALVVSCQPVPGGPFDNIEGVVAFARAAETAGAKGLRIEGERNVAAVVKVSALPVVGLVKRDLEKSPVRITPFPEDVEALADAGAAIIAVDATVRSRPAPVAALIAAIHRRGLLAMADISTVEEASAAIAAGADIVATTMSGYTGDNLPPVSPDIDLVRDCVRLGHPVFAEGRYNSPALARAAIDAGAAAVVVGSAITRPEHITGWFRDAVDAASAAGRTALAFDIGGTKTLAALVRGPEILDRRMIATPRNPADPQWLDEIAGLAGDWAGGFDAAMAVVTGLAMDGCWSALNPDILAVPDNYPLARLLSERLGVATDMVNDAQAAAWGEYRYGAGRGRDIVFITVSSGVGGGVVANGTLMRGSRGLAGSLGQIRRLAGDDAVRFEASASGFGMATAARALGREMDAREIFQVARHGGEWAERIIADAADEMASGLATIQALIDPDLIVIGGGVGLVDDFRDRLRRAFDAYPPVLVPEIVKAELGPDAGIIGGADLATGDRIVDQPVILIRP
ncbi:putative N-acetylmannosamine-6-phosphate 2-epimerase [Inquilinus sp. CAU 1745]|uniref:putative N-acetylmannosamine-6-phosphate 2-epimerase n=1 Tax=Inquilinus sp. CAU 1745 TaxID=3140369 RepID=UPI00325ACE5F